MRVLMSFMSGLVAVFLAAFLGFFGLLLTVAGFLALCVLGLIMIAMLLVAMFSTVYWAFHVHDMHAALTALAFYGYAAAAFAAAAVLVLVKDAIMSLPERLSRGRAERLALARIGRLRLEHESFS